MTQEAGAAWVRLVLLQRIGIAADRPLNELAVKLLPLLDLPPASATSRSKRRLKVQHHRAGLPYRSTRLYLKWVGHAPPPS